MKFDREHSTYSRESPSYGVSSELGSVLLIASVLLSVNIWLMVVLSDTVLAELTIMAFNYAIVGILIFGAILTIGRELALRGSDNGNVMSSFIGTGILMLTFGAFGAGVLSRYSSEIWGSAILYAGVACIIITIIATAYVTSSNRDMESWGKTASYLFIGGIIVALPGTFWNPLLIITFALFVLGFIVDVFYEIWLTTNSDRGTLANGIAVYVAVAGLFVHLLQIALQMMADQ